MYLEYVIVITAKNKALSYDLSEIWAVAVLSTF